MGPPACPFVDDSLWPLLRVTYPRVIEVEEQQQLFEGLAEYLERRERQLLMIDARLWQSATAEHRVQQWQFLKAQTGPMRQWSMGIVALISSPSLALVGRILIHRIKPSVVPYSIETSWPATVSWAAARLEENGLGAHSLRVRQRLLPAAAGNTG